MRIILGVGNPGNRYFYNRHNAGFMILDFFASQHSISFKPSKNDYWYSEGKIQNLKFILIKPSTFVNSSGLAAKQAIEKYKIDPKELLVVVDDVNLDIGDFRIRTSGGDGGHNGINSIIYHLNSNQFPRLRIGIGNNFDEGKMAEYVLTDFSKEELKVLEPVFEASKILIEDFIKDGIKGMLDANSKLSAKNNMDKEKRNTEN